MGLHVCKQAFVLLTASAALFVTLGDSSMLCLRLDYTSQV